MDEVSWAKAMGCTLDVCGVEATPVADCEPARTTPLILEAEDGRTCGSLPGSTRNIFIGPGVGIGPDRPADWTIDVGFTVVGF